MFIQTEAMPDPTRMKFFPGESVLPPRTGFGMAEFPDEESAERSPLARRLFEIEGVDAVALYDSFVTVTRDDGVDWQVLKPMILGAIMDHYTSGDPILLDGVPEAVEALEYPFADDPADAETIKRIHELMEQRIRPAAQQMGGDVLYKGFHEGVLYVQFVGPTRALAGGMTNLYAHFVAEVKGVRDYRDAIPKPGLETDEGRAVQQVLDERINPAVAGHGGHVQLIDVRDQTAYLRFEGGCQGCHAVDVTLKQGVEVEIMSAVPSIARVLDVTDHAAGTNPYYSA